MFLAAGSGLPRQVDAQIVSRATEFEGVRSALVEIANRGKIAAVSDSDRFLQPGRQGSLGFCLPMCDG